MTGSWALSIKWLAPLKACWGDTCLAWPVSHPLLLIIACLCFGCCPPENQKKRWHDLVAFQGQQHLNSGLQILKKKTEKNAPVDQQQEHGNKKENIAHMTFVHPAEHKNRISQHALHISGVASKVEGNIKVIFFFSVLVSTYLFL